MKRKVNSFFNKAIKFCSILAFILIFLVGNVKAVDEGNLSFKFTPAPSATEVKNGDTVKIALKLSDINVGDVGINTFSFKLNYDENFFENVSITSKNNWTITYNDEKDNEEYGKVLAILLVSGVTDDQEIGEISLKVKNNIEAKSGQVKFTEVTTNNGTSIVSETDKTVTVNIKEEPKEDENDKNNEGNQEKPDNNKTDPDGNNTSKDPIPQTGVSQNALIIAIVTTSLVAVVSYILYKRSV